MLVSHADPAKAIHPISSRTLKAYGFPLASDRSVKTMRRRKVRGVDVLPTVPEEIQAMSDFDDVSIV